MPSKKVLTGTDQPDLLESLEHFKINGGDENDTIVGTEEDDRVNAGDGDDIVTGGAGNDVLFGNDGYDTAVFSGSIFDYSWETGRGNSLIVEGADGTDTLKHFEALQFDDYTYDLTGNNSAITTEDAATVLENSAVDIDVLSNDIDLDGGVLVVDSTTVSDAGIVTSINLDGTVNYDTGDVFDYLAVGEEAIDTFTYTVSDGQGGSSVETVTVTIEGVNDDPMSAGGDVTGEATELPDGDIEEGVFEHEITGTFNFTDADLSDAHGIVLNALGLGYLGSMSAIISDVATGDGMGAVDWRLGVDDSALDSLADGESLLQSYEITVYDGNGGSYIETIDITLNGADDSVI